jgi:hypothetical protein
MRARCIFEMSRDASDGDAARGSDAHFRINIFSTLMRRGISRARGWRRHRLSDFKLSVGPYYTPVALTFTRASLSFTQWHGNKISRLDRESRRLVSFRDRMMAEIAGSSFRRQRGAPKNRSERLNLRTRWCQSSVSPELFSFLSKGSIWNRTEGDKDVSSKMESLCVVPMRLNGCDGTAVRNRTESALTLLIPSRGCFP